MKNNIFFKIFTSFILIFVFFVNSIIDISKSYASGGQGITKEYTINGELYNLYFQNDFQRIIFEKNQYNEIIDFFNLITTPGFTKTDKKILIDGKGLSNISIKKSIIVNPYKLNGKDLKYYFDKYDGDLSSDSFIETIITSNIPMNGSKNYSSIKFITTDFKGIYQSIPVDNNSTFSNEYLVGIANEIKQFYTLQLKSIDDFNYKLANDLLSKFSTERSKYLKKDDYLNNKTNLLNDFNNIYNFVNGTYSSGIINNYDKLFLENSLLSEESKISQGILTDLKGKFEISIRMGTAPNLLYFNNISGFGDSGKTFNYGLRTFINNKLLNIYNEILNKIEELNNLETLLKSEDYSENANDIINNIDEFTNEQNNIGETSNILGELKISEVNETTIDTLYKNEISKIKKRDIDFLLKNRGFLYNEESKVRTFLGSNTALLNEMFDNTSVVKKINVMTILENNLKNKTLEGYLSEILNISYDIDNDDINQIFENEIKKQMLLSINNPLLSNDYILPSFSSVLLDGNVFKEHLKGNLGNNLFLKDYRNKFGFNLVESESDQNLNAGFSSVTFSYSPNPVVIKKESDDVKNCNVSNDNIGLQLGNKKTFYVNDDCTFNIKRGKYVLNMYGINGNFNNIHLFIDGKKINVEGLLNIKGNQNAGISYNSKNVQTNFLPALWIHGVLK